MTYPAGVQLSTLTFNSPTTYLGNPVTRTEITVQVSAGVVWAATGETIKDITSAVALGPGMPGAVTFPAVDQSGFTNQSGTTITMWSYSVTRKMFFGSSSVVVQKNWQPLTGQVTTDFDTLPAGATVTPPPTFPVTSVAGKSGTVAASDLATAIAPFLPTPAMPGKLDASQVGAASGVAPLDPFSKVPDANLPTASNAAAVAGKVAKGETVIRLSDYNPAADGVTDDSTIIMNAANAAVAAGLPLIFNGSKRYCVNAGVTFPANLRVQTFGCTFVKTVNNSTYVLVTGDSFHADTLKLEIAGGASNDAGILVGGNDTIIDRIKVTTLTADQPGANPLFVGNTVTTRTNIRINAISITGFRSPMRVMNVSESRFANATISNFMTGVYVINTTDTTFDKFKVTGTSPSSTGTPGQNGMLMEAQNNDNGCINVRFRDWLVDGSPEHAYRIGGAFTVADITFEDCISRNPGNAPGNVATGGASFKVLGTTGHLHYNIRYINCTAEDGTVTASGINNHAGYHLGFVNGLTLINPTLRAKNKTYSAQVGMLIFACTNVDIVEPNIKDAYRQTLYMFKDSTEPSPPIGLSNIRINGGLMDGGSTGVVVNLDTQSAVMKDVFIDNLVVSRGGQAFRNESATTVGSDVGSYSNVNVKLRYINAPTGSTTPPNNSPNNSVLFDYTGPIYGTGTIPSADGGTYLDATGKRFIRKAGAWVQQ
jgi:hypothetical protein